MKAKLLNLSNNYVKWLLAGGLFLVLVLGFLQTPEVGSLLSPNFQWRDNISQLHKESRKVEWQLSRVQGNINGLPEGLRTDPGKMRQIKKDIVSIARSLKFMDARLASLTLELNARLPKTPADQRPDLRSCLAEAKTLQRGYGEYRRHLEEASRKACYFEANLDY